MDEWINEWMNYKEGRILRGMDMNECASENEGEEWESMEWTGALIESWNYRKTRNDRWIGEN